jgi:hypothetical protein
LNQSSLTPHWETASNKEAQMIRFLNFDIRECQSEEQLGQVHSSQNQECLSKFDDYDGLKHILVAQTQLSFLFKFNEFFSIQMDKMIKIFFQIHLL